MTKKRSPKATYSGNIKKLLLALLVSYLLLHSLFITAIVIFLFTVLYARSKRQTSPGKSRLLALNNQPDQKRNAQATLQIQTLLQLSPKGFEEAIATLMRSPGYSSVRLTGGAGDLSADILAVSPQSECTLVQCKRFALNKKLTPRQFN